MVSKDESQSSEVTPDVSYVDKVDSQYVESESYPRMLSNQPSDVSEVLGDSSSDSQYVDSQYYYGKKDDESDSVA
jgi:hypothetical protein